MTGGSPPGTAGQEGVGGNWLQLLKKTPKLKLLNLLKVQSYQSNSGCVSVGPRKRRRRPRPAPLSIAQVNQVLIPPSPPSNTTKIQSSHKAVPVFELVDGHLISFKVLCFKVQSSLHKGTITKDSGRTLREEIPNSGEKVNWLWEKKSITTKLHFILCPLSHQRFLAMRWKWKYESQKLCFRFQQRQNKSETN